MGTGIATFLTCLLLAAPAHGKRPRMTFQFAVAVAVDHWTKHGVTVPCRPSRRLLTPDETAALETAYGYGIDMAANRRACEVLITPVGGYYRTDPDLAWLYCSDVVHEIGHLAGLEHDDSGIMDPQRRGEIVPWGCDHPRRFARLRTLRRDGVGAAR